MSAIELLVKNSREWNLVYHIEFLINAIDEYLIICACKYSSIINQEHLFKRTWSSSTINRFWWIGLIWIKIKLVITLAVLLATCHKNKAIILSKACSKIDIIIIIEADRSGWTIVNIKPGNLLRITKLFSWGRDDEKVSSYCIIHHIGIMWDWGNVVAMGDINRIISIKNLENLKVLCRGILAMDSLVRLVDHYGSLHTAYACEIRIQKPRVKVAGREIEVIWWLGAWCDV